MIDLNCTISYDNTFGWGTWPRERVEAALGFLKDLQQFDSIRRVERASIREFVSHHRRYLRGRVLDFGAGEEPYRCFVEGTYIPFEAGDDIGACREIDAVLCTQVLQYVGSVEAVLRSFYDVLVPGGHLVLTYGTNWDEVEDTDKWRFTRAGMEALLSGGGWKILVHERRSQVSIGSYHFPLGYGLVAQKL